MQSTYKQAVIDDVRSRNIDDKLRENLLDLFESAMRSVSVTLVREATFDMSDFATARERNCEEFKLVLARTRANSSHSWFGAFQRGDERLEVIGHLE
jgi:hypothetical protein